MTSPGKRRRKRQDERRRQRGRPPQDERDQLVIDAAAALRQINGLGPQEARDLVLALIEGREAESSRLADDRIATQFELTTATFKGRSGHLQRKIDGKLKRQIKPRPATVVTLTLAFRGRDRDSIRSCLRQLAVLAALAPDKLRTVIERLSEKK
jgi:hypothetical protein